MSFNSFPKGPNKEAAPDPVGQIKRTLEGLEAEKEKRGLDVPDGGPELSETVHRILAEQKQED